MRSPLARALLCAIAAVALLASDQGFSRGYVYSHIGSLFTWKSSAQSSWNGSLQAVSVSDFETYVQNNGACSGSPSNAMMGLSAAESCAVNSTTIQPDDDPWLIQGSLNWTVQAGSVSYSATQDPNSPPSGAQDAYGTTSGFTIEQAVNDGATIIGGTHVTVSFDSEPQTASTTYYSTSSCTTRLTSTATGSTTIELLNASGGQVIEQQNTTTNQWNPTSKGGTVPSSGVYYVAAAVAYQTVNYSYYSQNVHGCLGPTTGSVSAGGRVTHIEVSN